MKTWPPFVLVILLLTGTLLAAQTKSPPTLYPPDEATLKKIKAKTAELRQAIQMRRDKRPWKGDPDHEVEDEVYLKAAEWIVKHNEWHHKDYAKWTLEALDRGLERARERAANPNKTPPWFQRKGRVAGAYRSRLDSSVQPFGLILPEVPEGGTYEFDESIPVHVILHGRDSSLTEVKFLHQFESVQSPANIDHIEVHIYGRGNNAYRWAGERDVFEVLSSLPFRYFKHPLVLRGFSMGGAGAWHLGLHYPARWCSVSPGAGFTTTRGYVKNLPEKLPPYQEACLHIYDAVDYAENAFNVPIVAYGGDKDPQLQAARNIEARLKLLGIPLTLIIGPNTEHRYHPDSLKSILQLQAEHAAKERDKYPSQVRFVTYTPWFSECHWVKIIAQDRQYERSIVKAEWVKGDYHLQTQNVRLLRIVMPEGWEQKNAVSLLIDGQQLGVNPVAQGLRGPWITLERREVRWMPTLHAKIENDGIRHPRKDSNTMGPIDHAFAHGINGFICVRGTGKSWHPVTQKYAEDNLRRFQHEWSKYFRGDLRIKDDIELTSGDLGVHHLILFGDPSSNSLIGQIMDRLPLKWTKEQIEFGGKAYNAATHVPALIYPSPVGAGNLFYIVLNSGHTFHAADFEGTNALLYPRLGDYAILKLAPTEKDPLNVEVVTAGLFDEQWQVPK